MENKDLIIIALIVAMIYLYYQNRKYQQLRAATSDLLFNPSENELTTFLSEKLNSNSLEELKEKLGEKTLTEILAENEDYETEVDTLTRTKNSLEQDLTVQSNTFQSRLREKERDIKKLKEDLASEQKRLENSSTNLTSEKQQHKGSLERIKLLTGQITNLEKEKNKLLTEINKHDDLDAFQNWLNEKEENKANLPDWDKILGEIKEKISDYHLKESNWASGLLTRNTKYWQVFKTWVDNSN